MLRCLAVQPDDTVASSHLAVHGPVAVVVDPPRARAQLDGAHRLAGQLEQAIASRAVIEQAKGVLMATRRLDEQAAFEWLRQTSQTRNVKVRTLAEQVLVGLSCTDGGH